jgi:hypothetical protein
MIAKMLIRITIFVIYTIVYFFLALMATGGGDGNFIFLDAPFPTWILSFLAVCLSNWINHRNVRNYFVLSLLIHYIAVFYFCIEYFQSKFFLKEEIKYFSWEIHLLMFGLFLSGQIYIWSFFFRNHKLNNKNDLEFNLR